MSRRDADDRRRAQAGTTTPADGTPVPVDTSLDRRAAVDIVALLAGPIVWAVHFMLVYVVAEAGCTGEGPGLRLFAPPVPAVFTLAATAVAALACLGCAWWAHGRWRAGPPPVDETTDRPPGDPDERGSDRSLAFAGFVLSLLFSVSVLMVGLPAAALAPC